MEVRGTDYEDDRSVGVANEDDLKKLIFDIERFLEIIHANIEIKLPNRIRKYLFGIGHFKDEIRQILLQAGSEFGAISGPVREMGIRADKLLKNVELDTDDLVPRDQINQLYHVIKRFERKFLASVSPPALWPAQQLTSQVDVSKLIGLYTSPSPIIVLN